jgi:hypothetical protein
MAPTKKSASRLREPPGKGKRPRSLSTNKITDKPTLSQLEFTESELRLLALVAEVVNNALRLTSTEITQMPTVVVSVELEVLWTWSGTWPQEKSTKSLSVEEEALPVLVLT